MNQLDNDKEQLLYIMFLHPHRKKENEEKNGGNLKTVKLCYYSCISLQGNLSQW